MLPFEEPERFSATCEILKEAGKTDTQMPRHAFDGQTPDEVYFYHADRVRDRLTAGQRQTCRARMEANRGESCRVCTLPTQQSMSVINAVANAPP